VQDPLCSCCHIDLLAWHTPSYFDDPPVCYPCFERLLYRNSHGSLAVSLPPPHMYEVFLDVNCLILLSLIFGLFPVRLGPTSSTVEMAQAHRACSLAPSALLFSLPPHLERQFFTRLNFSPPWCLQPSTPVSRTSYRLCLRVSL